jgi:hypothetical protein
MNMVEIVREFTAEPSNSKAPGASRHLSLTIAGTQRRFERGCMQVERGAVGELRIGCTFQVGQGARRRGEREETAVDVIVTGDPADSVEISVEQSQRYAARVTGVRRA